MNMLWGKCEDLVLMDGKTVACHGRQSICIAVQDCVIYNSPKLTDKNFTILKYHPG